MSKKALKVALLLGLVLLVVLSAGTVMAITFGSVKKPLPEYVGSKACLGCHSDRYVSWVGSGHGTMLTAITGPDVLPGDINATTPELKAELQKADFVVAGQRFLARNGTTGEMTYLNVVWNPTAQAYQPTKGGSSWSQGCAGCHSTNYDKKTMQFSDAGIGCEACHGPGRDHIAGKGDVAKVVKSTSSDVCGQCHGGGKMLDGTGWVSGYRPNMKLADVSGIKMADAVDLAGVVPSSALHLRQYPMWLASGHGPKAVSDLKSNDHASGNCYACHTQEAFSAKQAKKPFTLDKNADYVAISCVVCHRPHSTGFAMDEKTLCITCHNGGIADGGSLKPGSVSHHPMKEFFAGFGAAGGMTSKGNVHKELTCQECHMTEGNHLFKVIQPKDVLDSNRVDTCTTCHKDSSKDVRQAYLDMWQNSTKSRIDTLNADIAAIDAAVKAGATLSADQKLQVDTARTNVSFVTADGSTGAHNFDYATRILSAAQKDINAVKAAVVK
ncbi:MAG TPA: ammonia-forming cytochrome c nitrite reductase subunit c552 [Symbiobacteriaceae bacterium]|jgi:predicted CXXCH cytochrome family protein